jgi:hypothetical protein
MPTPRSAIARPSPRAGTAASRRVNEFPELSRRFNVMGVPKTVINASQELFGAQPEARVMTAIRAVGHFTLAGRVWGPPRCSRVPVDLVQRSRQPRRGSVR